MARTLITLCLLAFVSTASAGLGKGVKLNAFSIVQASFPPAPSDWAAATCSGYLFCVPGVIPPVTAAAVKSCPDGFTPDASGGGLCTRSETSCMLGTTPAPDGRCCAEQSATCCFPMMGDACPAGAQSLGSICKPSKVYSTVVEQMTVEEAAAPSAKEAALGVPFLKLSLPFFDLGKGVVKGKGVESKFIAWPAGKGKGKGAAVQPVAYTKVEVVPQCFSKCCKTEVEKVCASPKTKTIAAPALASCPDGCRPAGGGECVCSPGGPAPCPPGTRECASPAGRICVSTEQCFGLDACKVAAVLGPHVAPVTCPVVGGGSAGGSAPAAVAVAKASASASAGGR